MMLRIERTELTLIDAIEYDFHIKHPYTFMVPYFNKLMEGYAGTFYCLRCRLWGWVLRSPPPRQRRRSGRTRTARSCSCRRLGSSSMTGPHHADILVVLGKVRGNWW